MYVEFAMKYHILWVMLFDREEKQHEFLKQKKLSPSNKRIIVN